MKTQATAIAACGFGCQYEVHMDLIATFEKVSFEQYFADAYQSDPALADTARKEWEAIRLPTRATDGSAGYDFYSPTNCIVYDAPVTLVTGVRVKIEPGWVLMLFPRSGLGFKYGLGLMNTVGIVDSDYYTADNEGHIKSKLTARFNYTVQISKGDRFMQGVLLPYGLATNDADVTLGARTGGFGSTGV